MLMENAVLSCRQDFDIAKSWLGDFGNSCGYVEGIS